MPSRKSPLFPDVDFLLPLGPAGLLQGAGFKRAGRNFTRTREESIQGVYFRTSQFGASTFQAVATVFHRGHHEIISGRPFPQNPFPGKAIPLIQLEVPRRLEDGSKSPWWQVTYGAEIGPLSEDLAVSLSSSLRLLESWSDPEVVKERLLSRDPVPEDVQIGTGALASLLALSGDLAGATEALLRVPLPPSVRAQIEQRLREFAS